MFLFLQTFDLQPLVRTAAVVASERRMSGMASMSVMDGTSDNALSLLLTPICNCLSLSETACHPSNNALNSPSATSPGLRAHRRSGQLEGGVDNKRCHHLGIEHTTTFSMDNKPCYGG